MVSRADEVRSLGIVWAKLSSPPKAKVHFSSAGDRRCIAKPSTCSTALRMLSSTFSTRFHILAVSSLPLRSIRFTSCRISAELISLIGRLWSGVASFSTCQLFYVPDLLAYRCICQLTFIGHLQIIFGHQPKGRTCLSFGFDVVQALLDCGITSLGQNNVGLLSLQTRLGK